MTAQECTDQELSVRAPTVVPEASVTGSHLPPELHRPIKCWPGRQFSHGLLLT